MVNFIFITGDKNFLNEENCNRRFLAIKEKEMPKYSVKYRYAATGATPVSYRLGTVTAPSAEAACDKVAEQVAGARGYDRKTREFYRGCLSAVEIRE